MTSLDDRKEAARAKIDLRLFVAGDLGRPAESSGAVWKFRCPFHKDDTASFAVYEDHFHDFGACNIHGDVFSYVERRAGVSFIEALEMIERQVGLPGYTPPTPEPKKPSKILTYADAERYHYNVSVVNPYLASRCIPQNIIESRMIGADTYKQRRTYIDLQQKRWTFETNRVALPYIFSTDVYSLNFRRDDLAAYQWLARMDKHHGCNVLEYMRHDIAEKEGVAACDISDKKVLDRCFGSRFYRPNTRVTAYGVHQIVRREGEKLIYPRRASAVIVEGEVDQLSAEAEGFLCISLKALTNGNVDVRRLFQNVRVVFVATDPDAAGQKYAEMMLQAFGNDYTKVRQMILPDSRDFNKLHVANDLASFLSSKPYFIERAF